MRKSVFISLTAIMAGVSSVLAEDTAAAVAPVEGTLVRTGTADPCLVYSDGVYYLTMTGSSKICIVKDTSVDRLSSDIHPNSDCYVYDAASDPTVESIYGEGATINGTWSPEIHYFSEKEFPSNSGWYMYLALRQSYMENGKTNSRNVRMVVLKSASGRVDGPYVSPTTGKEGQTQPMLNPDGNVKTGWGLGPSVLRVPSGRYRGVYLMWVEEVGRGQGLGKFYQKIMISRLTYPWQLAGKSGIVTTPTQEWETHGSSETHPCVVEGGTAVYGDRGEVFLTYSGSGFWSDYGLGQLTLRRKGRRNYADPLETSSWIKFEGNPVLSSVESETVRGAGHATFITDGNGNRFLCYHAYPFADGVKGKARNAYIAPYYIDYSAACPSAPYGVIKIGDAEGTE